MPATLRTVPYFGLQPLQSSSFTELGATLVTAVVLVARVAAPALPVMVIWQMTAAPIAGTSSSRHLRPAPGGDPLPSLAADRRDDQGVRMRDPSRSRVPPVPGRPLAPAVTPV